MWPNLAILAKFGGHCGDQNSLIFGNCWGPVFDHVLVTCWAMFGPILGPILGVDRPKKGARWAQEGHQELQRAKKQHFQKPKKTLGFSMFLGSRGLPREPQEAQECYQEAPKELQNLKKKRSKNRSTNYQILNKSWNTFGTHFETQNCSKIISKMGPLLGPLGSASQGSTECQTRN